MRTPSLPIVIFVLAPCVPALAASQVCTGSTSFARSPYLVSAGAAVSSHSHGFGAGFTLGSPSTFLGVGIGTTHFDALKGSSFDVDVGAGYELPLDHRERIQLCPIVSLGHSAGPDNTPYGNYSETDLAAGIRLGVAASQSTHVRFLPTIGLGYEHSQGAFKLPAPLAPTYTTIAHGFGVLTARAGVVFGNRLTLLSGAAIPLGLANSSPEFDFSLAVNLGR